MTPGVRMPQGLKNEDNKESEAERRRQGREKSLKGNRTGQKRK